jgi:predicted HAD superfamily Cof-like phosphohydrolase
MQLPLPETPTALEPLAKMLHASLLQEELAEFAASDGLEEQIDGLIDLIYVAVGALLHLGLNPNQIHQAFSEVQCSNMTKVMDNGKPLINDGVIDPSKPIGKVLKTNNYTPPSIAEALRLPAEDN